MGFQTFLDLRSAKLILLNIDEGATAPTPCIANSSRIEYYEKGLIIDDRISKKGNKSYELYERTKDIKIKCTLV